MKSILRALKLFIPLIIGIVVITLTFSHVSRETAIGPSVQVRADQYHQSDTIRFEVLNLTQNVFYLSAHNNSLTYWLQKLDPVRLPGHPINAAQYRHPDKRHVLLGPFQKLSSELRLSELTPLSAGRYRIRVIFGVDEMSPFQHASSKAIEIVD